jgi:membrane-associated phospholipid phosphatase
MVPSLGAKSLYTLPPDVAARLTLSITTDYGKELVALLHNGPGYITPTDVRGLIAFPSYHGVLALIVTFYAWPVRWLRWPVLLTNALVLICTPIQGGHHLVDVLASFPVAALSIFVASLAGKTKEAAILSGVVNEKPRLSIGPVPQGLFRIEAEQKPESEPAAIKPKLSGAS